MSKASRVIIQLFFVLVILSIGGSIAFSLIFHKPELAKKEVTVLPPMVKVATVETDDFPVKVYGQGTVQPMREVRIVPQVSGKIVYISENLVNGGRVKEKETLIKIETVDYLLALKLAEAKVKNSQSLLLQAQAAADAAQEEWRIHHKNDMSEIPSDLVLKKPQLLAAKAALDADEAAFKQASLNLSRTTIAAPFNGRISQENVDYGQFVPAGQKIATLYGTDKVEVIVPLEDRDLEWIEVPGLNTSADEKAPAMIKALFAGKNVTWHGYVERAEGKLDEQTRMINVVVSVDRPFDTSPPLVPGLFVSVEIEGITLSYATYIPRTAVRDKNMVWVVDAENKLKIRPVHVANVFKDNALITQGLSQGDQFVLSNLKVVSDGMTVRTYTAKEAR